MPSDDQITDLLLTEELSATELADRLNITRFDAAVKLSRALNKGIVIRRKRDTKYPHFVYRVNPDGLKNRVEELKAELAKLEEKLQKTGG